MLGRIVRGLMALALLRRRHRPMRGVAESSEGDSSKLLADDAPAAVTATDEQVECESTVEPCDDEYAALDLAGLQAGALSPDEVSWLATHLKRCETCRIVLGILVVEQIPAEGTGRHVMPTGRTRQ
jgi:hypothetical protein